MDRSKFPTSWSRDGAGPGTAAGSKPPGDKRMNIPPRRAWWTFLVLLLVNYLLMRVLFPGEDSAVTGAVHRLQGGGRQGQRAGDLQPGREHRGPLQGGR